MKKNENNCPVAASLKLLGGKWTLQIIYEIGHGKQRFGELKRLIPEISEKMLIQELKKMANSKIIHRKSYPQIPPKVEYSLTERGLKVLPILQQIETFGIELLEEHSI